MCKILQLIFRQNIPRCWKFWMNKGFRIWSNGSNFGAHTLRNMSLFWHGVVTQDALMGQSHIIIPATICHWLHSREKDCSRQWLRSKSDVTEHLPLWSGPAEVVFSSFNISAFLSLASTLERLGMKHLFLSKVGALYCRRAYGWVSEQYLYLQGLSCICAQMRST